jgi:tetratricopeptide (TPR) repeat protein
MVSERDRIELAAQTMGQAKLELERGDSDAGVASLQQVVRLQPEFAEAREQLGEALLNNGNAEQAATEFRKAVELRPDSYAAYFGLGRALAKAGPVEAAVEAFRNAVRLRPSSAEAQKQLEIAEQRRAKQASLVKPQDAVTAGANPARGAEPPALPAGDLLRATSPDDQETMALIEGHIRRQEFQQAEPLLLDYTRQHPESSWGHYALGYVYYGQQRLGDAIRELAGSLKLDINNAEAHKMLGKTLMVIGRYDAALIEMQQAVQLDPQSAEIRYNLGKIHSANDNYPLARPALEEAVRLDPNYMEAYDALGFVCESLGDDATGLSHYRKAVELNEQRMGSFVAPYLNLSAFYNRTGQADEALTHAQKAIQLDAKSDAAYFQAGKAYARQEQWEKAVEALEEATALNPSKSSYYYVLGNSYRSLGRQEESRQAIAKFQELEQAAKDFESKRRELWDGGAPAQP